MSTLIKKKLGCFIHLVSKEKKVIFPFCLDSFSNKGLLLLWGGYVSCDLILKKAIANSSTPIHIKSRPNPKRKINTAPTNNSVPAVENSPTVDFAESCTSERLTKKVDIMPNTQSVAITNIAAVMNGIMSPNPMLLVFGTIPERDERVCQSPFSLETLSAGNL